MESVNHQICVRAMSWRTYLFLQVGFFLVSLERRLFLNTYGKGLKFGGGYRLVVVVQH